MVEPRDRDQERTNAHEPEPSSRTFKVHGKRMSVPHHRRAARVRFANGALCPSSAGSNRESARARVRSFPTEAN